MITDDQLSPVGRVTKTHGIQGELNLALNYDFDLAALRCLVFDIDGINVPFFPEFIRPRGPESALVKLEGVDSDVQGAAFVKHTVYALSNELPDELETFFDEVDGYDMGQLVGMTLRDLNSPFSGRIADYDASTENVLLSVEDPEGAVFTLPFSGDLVHSFDPDAALIVMDLPGGVLDI